MRPAWEIRVPLQGWLPAAVLSAVLLGIAAMHGLAPHGGFTHDVGHGIAARGTVAHGDVSPPEHGSGASRSAATESGMHAGLGVAGPDEAGSGILAGTGGADEASTRQPALFDAGTVQACVAVLLVMGAVLLTRRRHARRPALLVPRSLHHAVVPCRHREPDPPSLAQLAVLRC